MVFRKRKKNVRQRGSKTHGWGAMKKHRGAGNRGGRGRSGSGKKGDAMKPSLWHDKHYFGKLGFIKHGVAEKIIPVNLSYLEINIGKLVKQGLAEQKGDVFVVDVKKLGFNKVLGCGKLSKKFRINSPSFSREAVEKIKAAGGEVAGLKKSEPSAEKKSE
jgi:large subunit ribosomal protein L15